MFYLINFPVWPRHKKAIIILIVIPLGASSHYSIVRILFRGSERFKDGLM